MGKVASLRLTRYRFTEYCGYHSSQSLAFVAKRFIPIPPDPLKYDTYLFPYWHTFRVLHIGARFDKISLDKLINNINIIITVNIEQIRVMSLENLLNMGIDNGMKSKI